MKDPGNEVACFVLALNVVVIFHVVACNYLSIFLAEFILIMCSVTKVSQNSQ